MQRKNRTLDFDSDFAADSNRKLIERNYQDSWETFVAEISSGGIRKLLSYRV